MRREVRPSTGIVVALVGFLATGACGRDEEGPCTGRQGTVSQVTLGTGLIEFVPLSDNEPLPVYAGAQGRYHIYGAMEGMGLYAGRLDTVEDESPRTQYELMASNGDSLGSRTIAAPLFEDGQRQLRYGDRIVLALVDPDDLAGQPVVFSVTVTDFCGNTASDTLRVVLTAPLPEGG